MINTPKKLFLTACVCMLSFAASAQSGNPFIGTWDLNPAGSNFGSTEVPSSMIRTYQDQGDGGFMYLLVTINNDGSIGGSSASYKYDGRDNPIAILGVGGQTTISYRQVNEKTVEYTVRAGGLTSQIGAKSISNDGRVLTIVIQNISATGGPSNNQVLRFDRRR